MWLMLKFLRLHTKRIFITILLLIIPAFCFFGLNLVVGTSTQKIVAGKLFGKTIQLDRFSIAQRETRNQMLAEMILLFGVQNFDQLSALQNQINEFLTRQNLNQLTWERLMLLKLAQEHRIPVNSAEIANWIREFPLFQSKGRFDPQQYQNVSRNVFGIPTTLFEKELKRTLQIKRVQSLATQNLFITDVDLQEAFSQENKSVVPVGVKVSGKKEKTTFSNMELNNFFQANTQDFRKAPELKVAYFFLKKGEEENEDLFYDKTSEIAIALIRDKATEVAKEYNLTLQETPFFTIENSPLPHAITEQAFQLELDEFSRPFTTEEGVYLVKPLTKKPSRLPTFEESKEEVKAHLQQERELKLAKIEAEDLRQRLMKLIDNENLSFPEAAKKLKLRVQKFPKFNQKNPPADLPKGMLDWAFKLGINEVSPILPTPSGALIFAVTEIDVPEYKEDPKIVANLKRIKQLKLYQSWLAVKKREANLVDLTPFL